MIVVTLNGRKCKVEIGCHFDQPHTILAVLIELYFQRVAVELASETMPIDQTVVGSLGADLLVKLCYPLEQKLPFPQESFLFYQHSKNLTKHLPHPLF